MGAQWQYIAFVLSNKYISPRVHVVFYPIRRVSHGGPGGGGGCTPLHFTRKSFFAPARTGSSIWSTVAASLPNTIHASRPASLLASSSRPSSPGSIVRRRRPSAAELERRRREYLATQGRITDGSIVDARTLAGEESISASPHVLLMYRYRIAGVTYDCGQDVSSIPEQTAGFRIDQPVQVKYDTRNPGNSIIVSENWSGLRMKPRSASLSFEIQLRPHPQLTRRSGAYTRYMHDNAKSSAPESNGGIKSILKFSLALTLLYILATLFFGLRAHSLALLSEAGHNVSDFLALALSFVAVYLQSRPATSQKTFGYQRAGVLAAFVNALTLLVLAAWIALAAIHRFADPVTVQPRA